MNWTWIDPAVVLAIHDEQLAEYGGMRGVMDRGLLESALARPAQLQAYGDPDVLDLAAAYAHGIARNHPFVDGNKRTAYVVCMLFLRIHGFRVKAPASDRVILFERLGRVRFSRRSWQSGSGSMEFCRKGHESRVLPTSDTLVAFDRLQTQQSCRP